MGDSGATWNVTSPEVVLSAIRFKMFTTNAGLSKSFNPKLGKAGWSGTNRTAQYTHGVILMDLYSPVRGKDKGLANTMGPDRSRSDVGRC